RLGRLSQPLRAVGPTLVWSPRRGPPPPAMTPHARPARPPRIGLTLAPLLAYLRTTPRFDRPSIGLSIGFVTLPSAGRAGRRHAGFAGRPPGGPPGTEHASHPGSQPVEDAARLGTDRGIGSVLLGQIAHLPPHGLQPDVCAVSSVVFGLGFLLRSLGGGGGGEIGPLNVDAGLGADDDGLPRL